MSDALKGATGPYRHAVDAKRTKSFGRRSFTVLIASAYDAGIVGSEHNGIAVLDDDNRTVVLDRHMPISSGYFGPSDAQRTEMARIMAMDWKTFTDFVRSNPGYRGSLVDIDMPIPDEPIEIEDREIYPESARIEGSPYAEALTRRRVMVEYLVGHGLHCLDGPYSRGALSWDVKVPAFDTSGRIEGSGFNPEPENDARWDEYVQSNGELFWEAAEQGIYQFEEGAYTLYGSEEQDRYQFRRTGRSSGNLVLTGFKGRTGDALSWSNRNELSDFLQDLCDADLVELYRLVNQVDQDLTKPKIASEMAFQFASLREGKEQQWAAERNDTLAI